MSLIWYFELRCEILHIMSITSVMYYMLAYFKLVCGLIDHGKVIY